MAWQYRNQFNISITNELKYNLTFPAQYKSKIQSDRNKNLIYSIIDQV